MNPKPGDQNHFQSRNMPLPGVRRSRKKGPIKNILLRRTHYSVKVSRNYGVLAFQVAPRQVQPSCSGMAKGTVRFSAVPYLGESGAVEPYFEETLGLANHEALKIWLRVPANRKAISAKRSNWGHPWLATAHGNSGEWRVRLKGVTGTAARALCRDCSSYCSFFIPIFIRYVDQENTPNVM